MKFRKIETPQGWSYASGDVASEIVFDIDEKAHEVNVLVRVRSEFDVTIWGTWNDENDIVREVPLYRGRSFNTFLKVAGYDMLVLRRPAGSPWAYEVAQKVGRSYEKIDPTKLNLVGPRKDVSDIAQMIDAALSARFGETGRFEDPANALSFEDVDPDEFGRSYMEEDPEIGDAGYQEDRPDRRDRPPPRQIADDKSGDGGDQRGTGDAGGSGSGTAGVGDTGGSKAE